jgi:hypothetical protein
VYVIVLCPVPRLTNISIACRVSSAGFRAPRSDPCGCGGEGDGSHTELATTVQTQRTDHRLVPMQVVEEN